MVIVYESKTGFTKRYAEILAAKAGLKVFHVKEISKIDQDEEIIFLGWMKVGKIQGLNKVRKYNVKAVCGSGTGRTAEPDVDTVVARNSIEGIPFFTCEGLFTAERNQGYGQNHAVYVCKDAEKPQR